VSVRVTLVAGTSGRHPTVDIIMNGEKYTEYLGRVKTLMIIHILEHEGRFVDLKYGGRFVFIYDVPEDVALKIKLLALLRTVNKRILDDMVKCKSVVDELEELEKYRNLPIIIDNGDIVISADFNFNRKFLELRYLDKRANIQATRIITNTRTYWYSVRRFVKKPLSYILSMLRSGSVWFRSNESGLTDFTNFSGGVGYTRIFDKNDYRVRAAILALKRGIPYQEALVLV